MRGLLYALLTVALVTNLVTAATQRYIVTGKFMCGSKASVGDETSVKVLDKNIGRDQVIGKMKVNNDGSFRIDGTSSGLTRIDPELHIYTDCNDGKPCQRRWKMKLPKKYIDDSKGYDIGTINLESELVDGEDRDCWHV